MNILITTLVAKAERGGISNYVYFLIKHLQVEDKNNQYYIVVNEELDRFLEINAPNFKKIVIDIPFEPKIIWRPIYFFWHNFLLKKLIAKYKIDVVHIPNPIPLRKNNKIKTVVTIHDVAEFIGLRHTGIHGLFRKFVTKSCCLYSSGILTVSHFSKNEIIEYLGVKSDKISVTHLAIALVHNLDLQPTKKKYFLHVGGKESNKNVKNIIRAYIKSNVKLKLDLVFVGNSTEIYPNNHLNDIIPIDGIRFIGYVTEKELIGYYRDAIALIYPSLYEGFGLPILEAMSLGVPVITSDRASMPEVAGDAALYVNPEDATSIQEAMENIMKDDNFRESLIKKGLARSKKFDWKQTAKNTILAYTEAVQRPNKY